MSWDIAVMVMIAIAAAGFMIAEGERARVRYVQAMMRCLLRMKEMIRYEQPSLGELLARIDLKGTPQERQLTELLHTSGEKLAYCTNPQLLTVFSAECAKRPAYGVLSEEDRAAFENLLGELGRTGLDEQLRLMDAALQRLGRREQTLSQEADKRARLIRTLGLTGGAAVFLLIV